jgi:hypothetical protein
MTQPRPRLDAGKPQGRSRTTNGAQLLPGIDGRSPIARRFRDILRGYEQEFHINTEHERTLARQAATLAPERRVAGQTVVPDVVTKLRRRMTKINQRRDIGWRNAGDAQLRQHALHARR